MPQIIRAHFSFKNILYLCGGLILAGGIIVYIAFQARLLITGPTITLSEDVAPIQHSRTVAIRGVASNIVSLTLNDRPIFTNDAGDFAETLVLPDGYTIMTLKAKDRYGREVTLTRPFVHTTLF